jgi:hypothetical protein
MHDTTEMFGSVRQKGVQYFFDVEGVALSFASVVQI